LSDLIEPAKGIKDAAFKEDRPWIRSVMHKVPHIDSQDFLRELIRIRPRTQTAPTPILDDSPGAIPDDGISTSLQRQQERSLPRAGSSRDHDS
jgi:hypothetical protein